VQQAPKGSDNIVAEPGEWITGSFYGKVMHYNFGTPFA
jgi:hypothetical protein